MIQTYDQLNQLVATQLKNYIAQEENPAVLSFQSEENGSCTVSNKSNGTKFKFMLAKFGEEYKVGFAMFEEYQPQPVWIDDILSSNFDEKFVATLINEHLV